MADFGTDRQQPTPRVFDHPGGLHQFADVLAQRNIAVGIGSDGHVVLARPDSVLIEPPDEPEARRRLQEILKRRRISDDSSLVPPKDSRRRSALVKLGGRDAEVVNGERRHSIGRAAEFAAEARAAGVKAELNHVLIGAQTIKGDPLGATAFWAGEMAFIGDVYFDEQTKLWSLLSTAEPAIRPSFLREPLAVAGHTPPRILVLDTGLRTVEVDGAEAGLRAAGVTTARRAEHRDLTGVRLRDPWRVSAVGGEVDDEDEELDPPVGLSRAEGTTSRVLDFEAGHGTFISGIIRQHCPDAEVLCAGVLSSFGDGDVDAMLATLDDTITRHGPFDLVVMSFGTNLADDEPGVFGRELMRLLGEKTLGVAAAGNQGTCRPYFPAALPKVIGVGALAAGGKAWFTNFGGWVDACAPGIDVVSTFFENFDEVLNGETTRQYRGWARWSGTSFSAPKVAAVIAQEQYLFGGTAKDAWKRITSHKHYRHPDLGIAFNV